MQSNWVARICSLAFIVCLTSSSLYAHFIPTLAYLDGATAGNASPAIGVARVELDVDLVTMRVFVDFSGLTGNSVAANIFIPTPGGGPGTVIVNAPLTIPTGVTAGTYDQTFDMTVASGYDPGFILAAGGTVSNALEALHDALDANEAFFTLTSTSFAGGEISGNLVVVPEPATLSWLGITAIGVVVGRRKFSRRALVAAQL